MGTSRNVLGTGVRQPSASALERCDMFTLCVVDMTVGASVMDLTYISSIFRKVRSGHPGLAQDSRNSFLLAAGRIACSTVCFLSVKHTSSM
jgi:hypothetical protein